VPIFCAVNPRSWLDGVQCSDGLTQTLWPSSSTMVSISTCSSSSVSCIGSLKSCTKRALISSFLIVKADLVPKTRSRQTPWRFPHRLAQVGESLAVSAHLLRDLVHSNLSRWRNQPNTCTRATLNSNPSRSGACFGKNAHSPRSYEGTCVCVCLGSLV
jgi:hypothetical protein